MTVRRLTLPDVLPAMSPVDLQDADIVLTPEQRAYLLVFDERVRSWRTWDTDSRLQWRYAAAFGRLMDGAYPAEEAA